mmetsp:Transcript_6910/g.12212  ORF Transcript_6910/g.12212 Transcript_6910/m.12212 type:complete len:180 (+) Transcript_6910:106-645(+)|eukprot:CAMPEP_0197656360 /NCGR_PEP_ID=MMETSP1338-20131121/41493_1 /TAXON_ID=43686 ORGANISM="Pelagodinium beii, Strain RCC1491" /NCGR_SAMPLE_ID=MMETSP1338 /ASSEMBLY_ACC=CAM_ASM_000754 /LENGTH=179 /DNA_ID=CAMNT_0043232325 /DNA_START=90 /DNA_END=629 /DNA_ORIENTATION=+
MHHQHAAWLERLGMETANMWRHEDQIARGKLATVGAGTLGQGISGGTTIKAGQSWQHVEALHKTLSMPTIGPHPPCGRRVGDDLGVVSSYEQLEVPPLRKPTKLSGDLEDRLLNLESSFSSGPFLYNDSFAVPSTGGRATGRLTASRGSLMSAQGSRLGSALPTPLHRGRSALSTPMMR